MTAMVHGFNPGATVEIELLRAGAPMKVDVTLGSTRPGPVGGVTRRGSAAESASMV